EYASAHTMLDPLEDMASGVLHDANGARTADALWALGRLLVEEDDAQAALPKLERALATFRRVLPPNDTITGRAVADRAPCLHRVGRDEDAGAAFDEGLRLARLRSPEDSSEVATALSNVATLLVDVGRAEEALPKMKEALELTRQQKPASPVELAT